MYSQAITQQHRSAFIIAIDISSSMQGMINFHGLRLSKAEAVALCCNYMIDELIARATRNGIVRHYYDIAIIGYGNDEVTPLLKSGERGLVANTLLAEQMPPLHSYTFEHETTDNQQFNLTLHRWIVPQARGNTPMLGALRQIENLVERWCNAEENRNSHPPMVINITDGEFTDGNEQELIETAEAIKACATNDGNTLLINIHLSSDAEATTTTFPSENNYLSMGREANILFGLSSTLPTCWEALLSNIIDHDGTPPYRGVAINTPVYKLLSILNIGSESQHESSKH